MVTTGDGRNRTPALPEYAFKVVYGWADDDTALVAALRDDGDEGAVEMTFLECDIPTGICEAEGQDTVTYGKFALPVGEHMGD